MIGKWEALATIPTGDWEFALTDNSGGPYTITLTAANTYYHSSAGNDSVDLPAKLKELMDAASGQTYTVSVSAGVSGTGKYTISVDSGTFTISWTDTALRNLLGIDAGDDVSAVATVTGSSQAEGLWLPQCPVETPYGLASQGIPISAADVMLSPDGTMYAFHGPLRRENEYVYRAVDVARVIASQEGTVNESFEQFWLDAIRGDASWATAGRSFKFYEDAGDDATFLTYHILTEDRPTVARLDPTFDGLWTVTIKTVDAS